LRLDRRRRVVLIEWGERFPELMAALRIEIHITRTGDEAREVEVIRLPDS
jgi:tRNA A37 threonylcarbamoyladenosine biosynthesis protein TsaE